MARIAFGNRNRGQGRGYWHEMGSECTDPNATATSEFQRLGLDYTISKRPLSTRNAKGHHVTVPDYYAVLSDFAGDPDIIAIVGREFEPIQNMHLAELLDQSGLTKTYAIDVTGKTADGRMVFCALKAREPYTINGDVYRDHWLLSDGKDGNRALGFALTPVRHICSNALAMAIAGASVRVGIQHTKAAQAELKFWLGIAPKLDVASKRAREVMSTLGSKRLTAADVSLILETAYPKPKTKGKAQLADFGTELGLSDDESTAVDRAAANQGTAALRQIQKQEAVRDLFVSYADDPDERNIAGTALGLVNAVADFENHREQVNIREIPALSNFSGQRYISQAAAIREAMRVAGIKNAAA